MATAYWRSMRGALFGAQASYRNCSPTGAGWLPKPNGKGVDREATSASPGQERCVGPFAFTKGPLVMLSAPVVYAGSCARSAFRATPPGQLVSPELTPEWAPW